MYKSPVEMVVTDMKEQYENNCVKVIQSYGFNIDKEELEKALSYDRNQYTRGFNDGYNKAKEEFKGLLDDLRYKIR